MKTTTWVILILATLDLCIFILARWFDRRFYVPARTGNHLPATESFFNNRAFDEPLNRFLLSKGGMMMLSLVFVAAMALTMKTSHGAI